MLGKTANGIFWMARYLERAENTARLIETGQRIALTRLQDNDDEWASILQSSGTLASFQEQHDELNKDAALDWMLRSTDNPSSIKSCIEAARQNARLVRTALTGEVWEAINAAYMRSNELLSRKVSERDLPNVLNLMRRAAAMVRGMVHGSMMRNDIYDFLRAGTVLERADNTARILDVKYYVLLPSINAVGSSIDNVQWESILRSVSARGGFRMVYGAATGPKEIAQFLILDRQLPRSLAHCVWFLRNCLESLAQDREEAPQSLALANALLDEKLSCEIESIFEQGLHEFIQSILQGLADLTNQLQKDFRFID